MSDYQERIENESDRHFAIQRAFQEMQSVMHYNMATTLAYPVWPKYEFVKHYDYPAPSPLSLN